MCVHLSESRHLEEAKELCFQVIEVEDERV